LACSIAEQKALRSLPASFAPTSSRVLLVLEAMLEVVQTVVQRTTLPTACCRTPFEGVSCVRFHWPAPDAAPCSPSSFEQAHCAAHVVLALMGSPCEVRSYASHCPGLSVRGGPMQVDDATHRGLILLQAQGQTSAPMLPPAFEARLHPQSRQRRNAKRGRITVSFLRLTEPTATHPMRHRQTLGRQTRRGRVSCRKPSTTPLTRYGIRA